MVFEFDEKKSKSNFIKHGIDFEEAQMLWNDPDAIEIEAKTVDEKRYVIIGKIGMTCWSAIITYRGNNIRIISVRRARKQEIGLYESEDF